MLLNICFLIEIGSHNKTHGTLFGKKQGEEEWSHYRGNGLIQHIPNARVGLSQSP